MGPLKNRLMVVSDIHFLARELYAESPLFLRALQASDGKVTHLSDQLMEALVKEVRTVSPDALIVTGDLSLNGEKQSHTAVAGYLACIRDAGTPVYVIPGNHDILSTSARRFIGENVQSAENLSPEGFRVCYQRFLGACTGPGFSYVVPLAGNIWVVMLDTCVYRDGGRIHAEFTPAHERWLLHVLSQAKQAGIQVITASHHALIPHTRFAQENFAIRGRERMLTLLAENDVRLHLSGHLHAQHISREKGVTDAATTGFCITPHGYALVSWMHDGTMRYEMKRIRDAYLPEKVQRCSRDWFLQVNESRNYQALAGLPLSEVQKRDMAAFSARFSLAFFTGAYHTQDRSWEKEDAYALWKAHPAGIFGAYFSCVTEETHEENMHATVLSKA
ncbi:MAG: metallophosphoesterase [Clostridia bacterium]|nr:metallophosphoesterase [Clostridia bacterium]